jgi:predicted DCC family thiol-disulfide oxidoreductase YuxK
MRDRREQAKGSHLLLYDGECGFCHWMVRFVLTRDRRAVFQFAALQSETAARELEPFGGRPVDLTTSYVIENYRSNDPVLRIKGSAMLLVANVLGWPWSAAGVLHFLPSSWLDAAYDLLARHRHEILGRTEACIVPRPQDRERFLNSGGAPAR